MNLLALVQSLHVEAKQPGNAPTALATGSGRAADLVRWIVEAYNDIQRDKNGQWKWLRREFNVDTAADDADYAYGEVKDSVLDAVITRFRAWDLDGDDPPYIYKVSDGAASERELLVQDWRWFRSMYVRATHTSAPPSSISTDHADTLYLGPTPDGIYRVSGYYWRSNQTLSDATDVPEMPADYHMLIVYRAMVKYGYNVIAQELLARARSEGAQIYDALVDRQWYGKQRMRWPGALA